MNSAAKITIILSFCSISSSLFFRRLPTTRIFNGTPVPPHKWPHHVALCIRGNVKCGGSIVSREWVVTAAHCMEESRDVADYKVIAGAVKIRPGSSCRFPVDEEQLLDIESIKIHAYFGHPLETSNDIAMLKLRQPVTFSLGIVGPVAMQHLAPPIMAREKCVAMGWGATRDGQRKISMVLMEVQLEIQLHTECVSHLTGHPQCSGSGSSGNRCFDYSMFCAGRTDGGVDTCGGDSGGSVVCPKNRKWILAGITSWGLGDSDQCGNAGYGFYANMDRLQGFIDDILHPNHQIRDVTVISGHVNAECPTGYTNRVPQNLNLGGSSAAYICFKRSEALSMITELRVVSSTGPWVHCPSGMTKVRNNMQPGQGYSYLCYRKRMTSDKSVLSGGIGDIVALVTSPNHSQVIPVAYEKLEQPVHASGVKSIYLAVKSKRKILSRSLN